MSGAGSRSLAKRNKPRSITFRIPTPPAKKNRMQIITVPVKNKKTGDYVRDQWGNKKYRSMVQPNKESRDAEKAIAELCRTAVRKAGRQPLYGENDIQVDCVWDVEHGHVDVTVTDLGPPPKKHRGRNKDLVNMGAVVYDAMNGIAYKDDRQIAKTSWRKAVLGEEAD